MKKVSVKEFIWYAACGIIVVFGIICMVFGIIGYHMPGGANNFVKTFEAKIPLDLKIDNRIKFKNGDMLVCDENGVFKKISKDELRSKLTELGFESADGLASTCLYVNGSGLLDTKLYKDGYFSVQGDASQLSIDILDPKPGQTMIDMCAAPGGKSCAAAEKMKNEGKIYAFDFHEHRVKLIEKEANRLGLTIIDAKAGDSTKLLDIKSDIALCDVPCSGLGTLRRNPELKLKDLDLSNLTDIQYQILKNASTYAQERIVYSTCTINPDENKKQIERFLKENSSWELKDEKRLLPTSNGPDGFYIALLIKK